MAKTSMESGAPDHSVSPAQVFDAHAGGDIKLPNSEYITEAQLTRDGDDLVLTAPNGEQIVVEGYFSADPAPTLLSPDGAALTPNLVDSFSRSPTEFAAGGTASDETPVGAVEEIKGNATVTRADGSIETIAIGTPIYQGDIVETDAKGAVNITFIDETSMAVSENAKLAIDEYTFDPATENGTTNFSVLRGLFVFTSGLIGRDDPDDVKIDTPVGSIGIRGTIIAGDINPGGESKISVLEGAIVVTNGQSSETLSRQFETVRLHGFDKPMESLGVLPANDIGTRFHSVGTVLPSLFSVIEQSAAEERGPQPGATTSPASEPVSAAEQPHHEASPATTQEAPAAPDAGIINLNGTNATLPSPQTIAGQPSVSSDGMIAGTNIFAPAAAAAGTFAAASPVSEPVSAISNTNTAALATPTSVTVPTVVDTVQPPPSVIQNAPASTPPASSGGSTATPTNPLTFAAGTVNDLSAAGTVVGHIDTGLAGTTYSLNAANPAYFSTVANGTGINVVLTAAGAAFLAGSLDTQQLGALSVTATTADGRTLAGSYTTSVADSNAANTFMLESWSRTSVISDGNASYGAGNVITALGDVNRDGFDDFAFTNDTALPGQNHTFIVNGAGGMIGSTSIPTLISTGVLHLNPNPTNSGGDYSDTQIAGIGDYNGDGIRDYIIGQPNNNGGNGEISIVDGATGAYTRTITGPISSFAGMTVDGIGDFNNDGRADAVAGLPGSEQVYVMFGNDATSGVALTGNITPLSSAGTTSFGTTVRGIGDFNGDGYSDFAVGSPGAGGANNGSVSLYYGSAAGTVGAPQTIAGSANEGLGQEIINLGDINGDGKSDMIAGGTGNTGRLYLGGDLSADGTISTGNYTLSGGGGIGDFNGDGFDDFALSLADNTGTHSFVVFGRNGIGGTIDLSYLKNPVNALELKYDFSNDANDTEIKGIGDINGDGYDDFAIGFEDLNGTAPGNGGLAVVYGYGSVSPSTSATAANQPLVGGTGNDVFDDGGFSGVSMRGGAGQDIFQIGATSFRNIDGGGNVSGGMDYILAKDSLDFSGVNMKSMSGIEAIKYGGSGQTITLTMENLFNLLKTSDSGSLLISGNGHSGLQLILSDGNGTDDYAGSGNTATQVNQALDAASAGTPSAPSSDGSNNVFHIGGYQLLIDQSITVDAQ